MRKNEPADVFKFVDMKGPDECWPFTGSFGGRRRDPRPYFSAGGRRTMAYRIVWELVNGRELTRDELILHSCDNGAFIGCCNPAHLRVGTARENSEDMMNRERHGMSANMIKQIMRLLSEGRKQQEIADLFGCSREAISSIATGRAYKRYTMESNDETE